MNVSRVGQKSDGTYIVGLHQEQLGGCQEDAIRYRQDEASYYIELKKVRLRRAASVADKGNTHNGMLRQNDPILPEQDPKLSPEESRHDK